MQNFQTINNLPLTEKLKALSQMKTQFITFESFLLDNAFLAKVTNEIVSDQHKNEILLVRMYFELNL